MMQPKILRDWGDMLMTVMKIILVESQRCLCLFALDDIAAYEEICYNFDIQNSWWREEVCHSFTA